VAAALPEASEDLRALREADSVAVDPHKWLYAPIEAGCCLVRDASALRGAFAFHPPYFHFDESVVNFFDYGPQNSRGFRALKVWLAMQQVGADGYRRMLRDDMALAALLGDVLDARPDFERRTTGLSIVTFRYVPVDLRARTGEPDVQRYLDDLNRALLEASQAAGEVFVSNAVIDGAFVLRACIVNFHTTTADVRAVPQLLAKVARRLDAERRPAALR
jgi:glutamate/tyrosine decarboxylase-like PLP-dependent enzyme